MNKEVLERLEKISTDIAGRFFNKHHKVLLNNALDFKDVRQECIIKAINTYEHYLNKETDDVFDIFKGVAFAVTNHAKDMLRGAISHSKCIQQRTFPKNEDGFEERPSREIALASTADDFYATLTPEISGSIDAHAFLRILKGKDYKIAHKKIIEGKRTKLIAEELGYKSESEIRRRWKTNILPRLREKHINMQDL